MTATTAWTLVILLTTGAPRPVSLVIPGFETEAKCHAAWGQVIATPTLSGAWWRVRQHWCFEVLK